MNDIVKKLLELQKVDADLLSLVQEEKQIPQELKKDQLLYQDAAVELQSEEEAHKEMQAAHERMKLEIAGKEEDIKSLEAKQSQVKKNQEYQALTHEIATATEAREEQEKALEEHSEALTHSQEKVDEHKGEVDKQKNELLSKAEEAKKSLMEIKQKKARYREIRKDIAKEIPQTVLNMYERIFKTRAPLVVVPANNNVCGGCHINLPPQVVGDIMKGDNLITCECCARILYLADSEEEE